MIKEAGLTYVIFIAYITLVLIIGVLYYQKIKNLGDYIVSGRNLTWPIASASLIATGLGAGYSTGYCSLTFTHGYMVGIYAFAFSVAALAIGAIIAGRMRKTRAMTVSDIMDHYYGKGARILSAVAGVSVSVAWVGVQYLTSGILLNVFLGVPVIYGAIFTLVIVATYTILGGLWSVTMTDLIQFTIFAFFIFGLGVVFMMLSVNKAGGFSQLSSSFLAPTGDMTLSAMLSLGFAYLFGEIMCPWYAQRYFATDTPRDATITGWVFVFYLFFACGLGVVTIAAAGKILLPSDINSDSVFITMLKDYLPRGLSSIALAGVMAAIMSTADSLVNSATSIFMRDIYHSFINPKASDEKNVKYARLITLIFSLLPFIFVVKFPKIWSLISYTYLLWAPAIFVPLIVALYYGKASRYAGLYSMIIGMAVAIIWLFILKEPYGINATAAGVVSSGITFPILHLLTKKLKLGKWVETKISLDTNVSN